MFRICISSKMCFSKWLYSFIIGSMLLLIYSGHTATEPMYIVLFGVIWFAARMLINCFGLLLIFIIEGKFGEAL